MILSKKCPHCCHSLSLKQRKPLLNQAAMYCPYCVKPIRIKVGNQYVNSVGIGVFIGLICSFFTSMDIANVIIVGVIFSIVFQRYIDIFYGLEVAPSKDLL